MDKLTEMIMNNDGLNETEAKAKLNLIYYQEHCFTGCAGTNILRLLPPLCLTKQDADDFVERLKRVL